MAIPWTPALAIGVPEIDHQHQELFLRIKTYFYMLDEYKILHTCSGNHTVCGKEITEKFSEASDTELSTPFIEVCSNCQEGKKVAHFETKAEIVEVEPATGRII